MNALFNKIATIAKATLVILTMAGMGAIFTLAQFSALAAGPDFNFTLGANKTQVTAGEEFEYTITVTNTGDTDVNNFLTDVNLSDKVTYVAGSTTAEKGSKTISIPDNWMDNPANLGTLVPNQKAELTFKAKVKGDVSVGDTITSTGQVKADGFDWKQKNFSIQVVSADEKGQFKGGNFLNVANVTKGGNGWQEQSVSADPGNVIEFRVWIQNDGEHDARNVKIKANFPSKEQSTKNMKPSVTITSDNAGSITDSVDVNVSSSTYMEIYPGHAKIAGKTDLFDCPNECDFPEALTNTYINMGTVEAGEVIQIKFKGSLILYEKDTTTKKKKKEACLEMRIWEDYNANGVRDAGEPGLDWESEWRKDEDSSWEEYKTYADKDGMGGTICMDEDPDVTTRLRVKDWCKPTTATEQKGKLEFKKTKYFEFGCTRSKPTVKQSETPKQLPKTGATGEILVGLSATLFGSGIGMTMLRRRQQ